VLPDVAGFERELDYLVPAHLVDAVRVGAVVRAPLQGRRSVRGWVTAFPVEPPEGVRLRPLAKVSGWGPEPELVELAAWAAWRWAGRRRSLLGTATGTTLTRSLPAPQPLVGGAATGLGRGGPEPAGWEPAGAGSSSSGPGRPPADVGGRLLSGATWVPGTHVVRLPPACSATGLVMAAAARGPVLVLAPTTAKAEAGRAALAARGVPSALMPSAWAQARAGAAVVIGPRSAAWAPCPAMAAVVVLDAHDESYVQEQAPTWDAPTVAAERARRAGVPCFWVSACPTVDMLAAADSVSFPSRSEERAGWAALELVDGRGQDPRTGLFSGTLVAALRQDQRVVCVLNRKGRSALLDCGACKELVVCEHCGAALAMDGKELVCRRCRARRPEVCSGCGSDALRLLRPGVARAREQLEALAARPVAEVTAATGPMAAAGVLIGTEAVLHREVELHRTGGAGVVAFLDFDQELLASRFRANEEALALLARAARVVGGRAKGGRVIVQTRLPGHPVLEAALTASPERLVELEEPLRRELRLPPFGALALLSGPGAPELARSLGWAEGALGDEGDRRDEGALGDNAPRRPGSGADISVVALGAGRWVVRATGTGALADTLAAAGRPSQRVRVEVGPVRF